MAGSCFTPGAGCCQNNSLCNQHTTNSFPLKSCQFHQLLSIKEGKARRSKRGKLEKVEHAREKEKIGGAAGNESCTCMILEASLQARHLFKGLLPSSFIARKREPRSLDTIDTVGGDLKWLGEGGEGEGGD